MVFLLKTMKGKSLAAYLHPFVAQICAAAAAASGEIRLSVFQCSGFSSFSS